MKKTFIGLCFGLMVVILIVFGFSTSGFNKKITKIDFPVIGGLLPHDVEYKIDSNVEFSDSKIEPSTQNAVDEVYKLTSSTISKDKTEKLKKIFNLKNSEKTDMGEVVTYSNREHSLSINENGTYMYINKQRNNSKPIDLSDEHCETIANNFLIKNELLPSDFFKNGIAHETKTSALNPEDSVVIRKDVYFNRKLNNKSVYGVSRIIVSVGSEGRIDAVYSLYRDIKSSESVKIKPFNAALNDLKNFKGSIRMNGDAETVNIKKVDLVYWEDSTPDSKQTHIQPVYHFTGETLNKKGNTDIFEAFISAVPDELTVPIETSRDESTHDTKPIKDKIKTIKKDVPKKDPKLK